MLMVLCMTFLEKMPREFFCVYQGSDEEQICVPEDFCKDSTVVSYKPNMELSDSYVNWISQFDLACASKTKMGLLGTAFFLGWLLTLTFVPRLSDLYGRNTII